MDAMIVEFSVPYNKMDFYENIWVLKYFVCRIRTKDEYSNLEGELAESFHGILMAIRDLK